MDGGAEDKDVLVAFRGADQDLLLEHNAELLLALEHIAIAGCGSIRGCTTACGSIAAIIAPRAWRN